MRRTPVTNPAEQLTWESRSGKIKYAAAAWLLGLPIPIVILALLFGGCDW